MSFSEIVELLGRILEGLGVVVILAGAAVSMAELVTSLSRGQGWEKAFDQTRRHLARFTLLGLEVLIAADIIRSVATRPTFSSVGVLALIVAVRFVLSSTLNLEVDGVWPWKRRSLEAAAGGEPQGRAPDESAG